MSRIRIRDWLLAIIWLLSIIGLIDFLAADIAVADVASQAVTLAQAGHFHLPATLSLLAGTVQPQLGKLLYRTSEAKAAIGCGTTKLYELINNGMLEARRLGRKTYITAESLERFVASLAPVVTPTMARAKHAKWSGRRRKPRAKQEDSDPGPVE